MASLHIFCVLRRDNAPWFSGGESRGALDRLRQHRAIRQEVSDRIFAPIQSLENEGILYVFLVFQTEEVGQKDGGDSQTQLCGAALREIYSALLLWEFLTGCFAVSEREKVKCMVSS